MNALPQSSEHEQVSVGRHSQAVRKEGGVAKVAWVIATCTFGLVVGCASDQDRSRRFEGRFQVRR